MKKIPVLIKIETQRAQQAPTTISDAPETETVSTTELGTIRRTRAGYRLDIGAEDMFTVIDTSKGSVSMNVDGVLSSSLVFKDKSTCTGTYSSEDALLQVMTYTYRINDTLHEAGGSLMLDYEVMLGGSICERCITTFTPVAIDAPGIS
ncbi:MAG TPA: DUF1934 family protein [Bacillota bacterium]|nr:DUF1934 family protein [Bacillota bacterium]